MQSPKLHSEFKSVVIRNENGKVSKSVYNMNREGDKFSENYQEYKDDKLVNDFRSDDSTKSLMSNPELRKEIVTSDLFDFPKPLISNFFTNRFPLFLSDSDYVRREALQNLDEEYEQKMRQLRKEYKEKRNTLTW